MSRRKRNRGGSAAHAGALSAPPIDPTLKRGKRSASEPHHLVDEYAMRWFAPKLSENPDIDHQIQSICFAFEHMEDSYRQKCKTGDLDPANAEFRLRGMLDTIRTLKWFKENKAAILLAARGSVS